MKKYLLFALISIISSRVMSQDEAVIINASTKVSKKLTPKQVVDSLNARFPDAKSIKYYKIPADAAKKGWTITKEDELTSGQSIDYYTISFKRSDLQYYGLFAADGRLIRSKEEETAEHLPEAVKFSMKSLGAEHPGYKVVSKKYFRNLSQDSDKQYYEIIASNGKETKSLYYLADGTLMQIK